MICSLSPAYAYLDPGTGSMLLSAFVAIIAGGLFFLKDIYYKILFSIARLFGVDIDKTRYQIIFYSEGKNYWHTFELLLDGLDSDELSVMYLTSSEDDPALTRQYTHIKTKYIGQGNKAFSYLSFIEADLCVLTTPGLDVLQIQKSPGVGLYVHVIHSLAGIGFYQLYSFDYYDVILCSGDQQVEQIRHLERMRKTKSKLLLKSGVPYTDILIRKIKKRENTHNTSVKTILIAPTWGKNGLLRSLDVMSIKSILEQGFNVIIRPHPQSYTSEAGLLKSFEQGLLGYANLEWDNTVDNFDVLVKSDLLISDFSGIIYDFAFVFNKPVITVDAEMNVDGFEQFNLPMPIWDIDFVQQIGKRISKQEISEISHIINETLDDYRNIQKNIETLKIKYFYNEGCASSVVTKQLIKLLDGMQLND